MNLARSIRNPAASRIRPFCPAETAPHCKPPTVTLVPSVVDADVASAAMRVAWAARDGGAGRPWPLGGPARRARAARARGCVRGALLGHAPGAPFSGPARFQYRRSNMTFRLFFLESLRFGAAPAALQLPSSQLKAPMDGAHWHAQLVA